MIDNMNLTLPAGASDHGNPNLLCLPAQWTDIVVFFLGNYVAHAATIRTKPGDSVSDTVVAVVGALLFPVTGVTRGLNGIFSRANFAKSDLETAARAGALCKVIRVDEQAQSVREAKLASDYSWRSGKVHGHVRLPEGYGLALVHGNAKFMHDDDPSSPVVLSATFNAVSILVAMGQLAFAITTLYRSRGDQITRYGYAAFGLTVTQYALMSLINLVGNLICPQYPALYLVKSKELREALQLQGAIFDGYVGELVEDANQRQENARREAAMTQTTNTQVWMRTWQLPLAWIPTAISVGIIAALSHFEKGSSTHSQRIWTMTWLAIGSYVGALDPGEILQPKRLQRKSQKWPRPLAILIVMSCAAPAIGGFVVVGQMLSEYGVCTLTA